MWVPLQSKAQEPGLLSSYNRRRLMFQVRNRVDFSPQHFISSRQGFNSLNVSGWLHWYENTSSIYFVQMLISSRNTPMDWITMFYLLSAHLLAPLKWYIHEPLVRNNLSVNYAHHFCTILSVFLPSHFIEDLKRSTKTRLNQEKRDSSGKEKVLCISGH